MREFIVFTNPINPKLTVPHGEANGYVAVPPESGLWGIDYDDMNKKINYDIHGGLTFDDHADFFNIDDINCSVPLPEDFPKWYVYGFDTLHSGDNSETWPLIKVELEALKLKALLKTVELKFRLKINSVWRNNKTGNLYLLRDFPVYNATKNIPIEDQEPFAFYSPISNREEKWIRKANQFLEKFTYVDEYDNYLQEALLNYEQQEEE